MSNESKSSNDAGGIIIWVLVALVFYTACFWVYKAATAVNPNEPKIERAAP
jgi:hypothetical protein